MNKRGSRSRDVRRALLATVGGFTAASLACGTQPQPTAEADVTGDGVLGEAYVREAIRSLSPFRHAVLADRAMFESFAADLASLRLLSQRAEVDLLPQNPSIQHQIDHARDRILAAALIDAEAETRAPIGEDDLRRFFEENRQIYQRSGRVRFRQILLKSRAAAEETASQLRLGRSFSDLARELSAHPSARQGGEMGWLEEDTLEPTLAEATADLAPGERSAVIETPFGLHIVELQERAAPEPVEFEAVRDVASRRLRATRRGEVSAQLVEEIRASGGTPGPERVNRWYAEFVGGASPSDRASASFGPSESAALF